MTLLKQFKAFVDTKPADACIDNSEAWSNCAIGEFAKVVSCTDVYLTDFALQVCGYTELFHLLNDSRFQTYGELQAYLANEVV